MSIFWNFFSYFFGKLYRSSCGEFFSGIFENSLKVHFRFSVHILPESPASSGMTTEISPENPSEFLVRSLRNFSKNSFKISSKKSEKFSPIILSGIPSELCSEVRSGALAKVYPKIPSKIP